MKPDPKKFRTVVLSEGKRLYRDLPWRRSQNGLFDPYAILVSELMLQQTQVSRVVPKFEQFMAAYPRLETLARANFSEVMLLWNGLGYNRRAKYLLESARKLQRELQPWSLTTLTSCKGIGVNTAAAVRVYAYGKPEVFVETNIRTVFLHYMFHEQPSVSDRLLYDAVRDTLPQMAIREWYWALMDVGYHLKQSKNGHLHRAAAHKKQSRFVGSVRQARGIIMKRLTVSPARLGELRGLVNDNRRCELALQSLINERLIESSKGKISIATLTPNDGILDNYQG